MRKKNDVLKLFLFTLLLSMVILFLFYTSEDFHWGGGYWEKWLTGHFHYSPLLAHQVVFLLRKTMHFLGYGILGLLFWYYFNLWRLYGSLWLGLGATVLVAIYDEHTQAMTTFRTGKPEDVLLDACGAIIFCSLYWIIGNRGLIRKKVK